MRLETHFLTARFAENPTPPVGITRHLVRTCLRPDRANISRVLISILLGLITVTLSLVYRVHHSVSVTLTGRQARPNTLSDQIGKPWSYNTYRISSARDKRLKRDKRISRIKFSAAWPFLPNAIATTFVPDEFICKICGWVC